MPKAKTSSASSSTAAKKKEVPAQQKEELDVFTMTHTLSYLDSAGDVGRCTGLGKAWREASNAPDIWAKVMEKTQGLKPCLHTPLSLPGGLRSPNNHKPVCALYTSQLSR